MSNGKDHTGFLISVDTHKDVFLNVIDLQRSTQRPRFTVFAGTGSSLHSCTDFIEIMCMIKNGLWVRGTELAFMPGGLAPQ